MTTSVASNLLLNITSATSQAVPKHQSTAEAVSGFKQEYAQQLQSNQKKSSSTTPAQAAVGQTNTTATAQTQNDGESLPLDAAAGTLLAALPAEEQQDLLAQIGHWLAGLTPTELEKLQQQLVADPAAALAALPPELQDLLAKIKQQLAQQELDLDAAVGFVQLLTNVMQAEIDPAQLGQMQLAYAATGEPRLVTVETTERQPLMVRAGEARTAEPWTANQQSSGSVNLPATASKHSSSQDANSNGRQASERQSRLNSLIASLNQAATSSSSISATAGGVAPSKGSEALNQLLHAAGQGLGATPSSLPMANLSRVAAGLSMQPMMLQAAANANAQALANRLSFMHSHQMQIAEMRLDPPNLGSVRVQIRMQGEQASVVFQAPNAQARDLLEHSLPKLREMMAAEGMQLTDASVSEENFTSQEDAQSSEGNSSYTGSNLAGGAEEGLEETPVHVLTQPLGLIDYYA